MKRLRHLFLHDEIEVIGGDKLRLDGLNELETLESINSKSVCIADITNLTNLQNVIVTIEEDMDSLSKIVEYMSNNQCQLRDTTLIVESCDLSSGEGRNVVMKMLMSRSLTSLYIKKCKLECSFPCYEQGMCHNLVRLLINDSNIGGDVHMVEEMGKYPILKSLWLEVEEAVKTEMRFGANSFQELKRLVISGLLNIKKWEVEKGAMPKLEQLWIDDFTNLEKLPDGLRYIPTLQELDCGVMSEELKSRMRRGGENGEAAGEDYANFSHIPKIIIY